jgi:16S rRNA (cytosine967-C5)-methyltransferase
MRSTSLPHAVSPRVSPSQRKPTKRPSPARRAAFDILRRVELEGAYASSLLVTMDEGLRADDRALCHELVLGVLRRQLWLDTALEHFASRRVSNFDLAVKVALRLGLYQLRFLTRIPPSAAVNESVNLVRATGVKSAAGFVNAVLRQATRDPEYDPALGVSDPVEKLAIESSHPQWLIQRWVDRMGFEETAALARANNEAAPMAFRLTVKALETDASARQIITELEASGLALQPSRVAPDAWRVISHRTAEDNDRASSRALLRKFSTSGLIYFQDEASQLVSHLLGAKARDRVLDVAAAPGSKSTHLAALQPQAEIFAGDIHEHRVRTLRDLATMQRATNIRLLVHDATFELPFAAATFDRVLVDAPCSGTGTLRHNPEIRWRLKPDDIAELGLKQRRILTNSAARVCRGGLLLYSTCALERDENEAVAEDFIKGHEDFVPKSLEAAPDLLTESGEIRTWPHRHDVDGFFIRAFQRVA